MEDLAERERRGETRSWYRVPSKGVTADQRKIAWAVDEEHWQRFRGQRLKGLTTMCKLELLSYWLDIHQGTDYSERAHIQVLNYLGALKRGGFIMEEHDLAEAADDRWRVLK